MNRSESIKNIAIALMKFNSEVTKVSKDGNNPFFKSKYVTLDKLIEETREILSKNGLSVMQFPLSKEDGSIGIQTILLHETGEFIESDTIYMKPQKVNDPQQAGSIISYMRRYSYQAILNLNTGEDDDANLASKGNNKSNGNNTPSNNKILSESQLKRLYAIAHGKGYDKNTVVSTVKKKCNCTVEEMTKKQYDDICNGFETAPSK